MMMRRWVILGALAALGVTGLIMWRVLLVALGVRELDRGLRRAEANIIEAPVGSVVRMGADTLADRISIAGLRAAPNATDSSFFFLATLREPHAALPESESQPYALVRHDLDWTRPITLDVRRGPRPRATTRLGWLWLRDTCDSTGESGHRLPLLTDETPPGGVK